MTYKHSKWHNEYGNWIYTIEYTEEFSKSRYYPVSVQVAAGSAQHPGLIHTSHAVRYLTPDGAHELARALDVAAQIATGERDMAVVE